MSEDRAKPRGDLKMGIAASVLLHAGVAIAVLVHFSADLLKPEEQTPVQVQIVEPPKKEPAVEQDEAKKPPPPPKEKAEKPPEPAPKQEKPPEPERKQEPPQSKADASAQQQQAAARDAINGLPLQVLQPVFKYGEKDAGPQKNAGGNASSGEASEAKSSALDAADKSVTENAKPSPKTPGAPAPDHIELPKANLAADIAKPGAPGAESATAVPPDVKASADSKVPVDDPDKTEAQKDRAAMKPAKTLYSQNAGGSAEAAAAMAGVPRDIRISRLCTTELREQLRHAHPPYIPALLPTQRPRQGNVLDIQSGAFRTRTEWYNLSFRCEVDTDATRVVSFALGVGEPVPRDQWKARGFPE